MKIPFNFTHKDLLLCANCVLQTHVKIIKEMRKKSKFGNNGLAFCCYHKFPFFMCISVKAMIKIIRRGCSMRKKT